MSSRIGRVRAAPDEKDRILAGDDLILQPIGAVNHAITIHCPPRCVWPWLAQMGAGRAGWYAYDFIDNGGQKSAERILPEYQQIAVGSVFPAVPRAKDVFVVAQWEFEKSLVLSWRTPEGRCQTTWAFILEEPTGSDAFDRAGPCGCRLSSLRSAAMGGIAHRPPGPFHNAAQTVVRDRAPRGDANGPAPL